MLKVTFFSYHQDNAGMDTSDTQGGEEEVAEPTTKESFQKQS